MGKKTEQPDQEEEARRLKAIAETKFNNSNLRSALKHAKKAHRLSPNLDGLFSMLTAFKILVVASTKTQDSDITDWYSILQVEPFCNLNIIKKQYKKLALILHPDRNPFVGCEEAFKLVGEGFRVLSDKIRRKEYDMRLRIRLQEERVNDDSDVDAFWTACSRCRILHQFERKYLGHNLMCPGCKKSFKAVEVGVVDRKDVGGKAGVSSDRMKRKVIGSFGGPKKGSVDLKGKGVSVGLEGKRWSGKGAVSANLEESERIAGEWGSGRLRTGVLKRKMSTVDDVLERSKPKRVKFADEMMTLAEMQLEARKKATDKKKVELKENLENLGEMGKGKGKQKETHVVLNKSRDVQIEKGGASKNSADMEIKSHGALKKSGKKEIMRPGASRKSVSLQVERQGSREEDLEIIAVEDSDFYDFDKDRMERSFKKGQIWAVYDDDDGMPRHYGLIDEVASVNPFLVKLSWLDLQSNGDEGSLCLEKMGLHVSCGRFRVARSMTVDSVNIFSHVVDCERAAREVYRIYPKKGSVWALYNEAALGAEARNLSASDKRNYDIVVLLTTYSEMHGLSVAYLEKVDGYKSVFKRRETGCHAIKWLETDGVRLFSHQIPARKFTVDEVADDLKDCWELDPASLPSHLLANCQGR